MTPEMLSAICSMILSLLASYLPPFAEWYGGLAPALKRLLMLGMLAATALGIYALACAGLAPELGIQASCDQSGALALFKIFLAALVANQATFQISKPSAKAAAHAG